MTTGAGLSLAVIEDNVLQQLGIVVADLATVLDSTGANNLALLCNKSWWEVMDRFDFREKEGYSDISTVVAQTAYVISTLVSPIVFDALRNVSILGPTDNQYTNLDQINLITYQSLLNTDTNSLSQPTKYLRDSGSIFLWPLPDQIYSLRLHHLQVLADLPSGGPVVPQSWHEIIELGAVYRGFLFLRDYNSANTIRAHQLSMINSIATNAAKEDRYEKMAGVEVPVNLQGRRY